MSRDRPASSKRSQLATDNDLARARARLARFSKPSDPNSFAQYGLVSKGGDSRLQSSARERERYFDHIIRCFIDYCNTDTLARALRRFIDENMSTALPAESTLANESTLLEPQPIQSILLSLRKLRESLLNCERDTFTKKVFLLSARIAANIGHYQTYVPSILHLLQSPADLSPQELEEITSILALHQAHFTDDNTQAFATLFKHMGQCKDLKANKTFTVLQKYTQKDYYTWMALYNSESDSCKHRMMQFGLSKVLAHMALTITQSYFTILVLDFENLLLPDNMTAPGYIRDTKGACTWYIDGKSLIVRSRGAVNGNSKGHVKPEMGRDDLVKKDSRGNELAKKNMDRRDLGKKQLERNDLEKKVVTGRDLDEKEPRRNDLRKRI